MLQKLRKDHLTLQSDDGFTFSEFSEELRSIRAQLNHPYPQSLSQTQSHSQSQSDSQNHSQFEIPNEIQTQPTKLILALVGISEECTIYQRKHRSQTQKIPSLSQRIDEVIAYLNYMEDVEVCCRKNSSELSIYLESLTRVLGDQLYQEEKTSLDTFKK